MRDSLTNCAFEERFRALMSVLLSSFSVEMCCSCVTLLCFSVVCYWVVGTRVAVTHDRYLHDNEYMQFSPSMLCSIENVI